MNIDDLKDAWNDDEPKGMTLAANTGMLGKTTSAVGKIRKNMKSEFIAVLISYTFFIALMFYGMQSGFFFYVVSIFMFIIIVLNGVYFFRFFLFYKSMSRYDLNMRNSVRKFTYELELNTEIYKTYNFCVAPLAVLITFALLCGNSTIGFSHFILASNFYNSPWNLLIAFSVILIAFIITYICVNLHIRLQYGKYIAELKEVMNDLGDEE